MTTLCAFFLAEIGDKTQIATVGLAARFEVFSPVVIGTTLGMTLANIPAVLIGDKLADKLPVTAIRVMAAIVFAALGVLTLAGVSPRGVASENVVGRPAALPLPWPQSRANTWNPI